MDLDLSSSPLIGMLHLPSLDGDIDEITTDVILELDKLVEAEFSAGLIENFFDNPFAKTRISDFNFAKLSYIVGKLTRRSKIPLGLNILRNATHQSLSLATAFDLAFIRCNVWEGAYVTDQGIIEGAAYDVIELQKRLNSKVKIFADVNVKHAYPLGKFTIEEAAENALKRGKADAILVSGKMTGLGVDPADLDKLNEIDIKPIIGSGLNLDNIEVFKNKIAGAIVGTSIKRGKKIQNPIDQDKANNIAHKWITTFQN